MTKVIAAEYQKTLDAVTAFVSARVGIPSQELHEHTRIEEDVSIAGLDTIILYDDFFDVFQIVNPKDFNLDDYTTPEVFQLKRFVKALFSKSEREKLKVKTITIRHLTLVAMQRRWFEQE